MKTTNKTETMELMEFLQTKMQKLIVSDRFPLFKDIYRKKVHQMVNLCIEVKYTLVVSDETLELQEAIDRALALTNEWYCELYDKNDNLRKKVYKKLATEG